VIAGIARLEEIENHWDLLDLMDVHELLDLKEEADWRANRIEK
jgi:hypothetical protein